MKTNADTPILLATEMFARDRSFRLYKTYADIRYGSRVIRRHWGGRKGPVFNAISFLVCRTFKN